MTDQPWSPLSIDEAYQLLAPAAVPWWIAGGLAIDLFLGRRTRAHDDLDVQIVRGTELAIVGRLRGWELFTAHAGTLARWCAGDQANVIWCRPGPDAPWALELLVADMIDGQWIYRRDRRVSRAVAEIGHTTPNDVPFLRPEIQLLYKSQNIRAKDEADFCAVLPTLDPHARAWLHRALAIVNAEHVWLDRLR